MINVLILAGVSFFQPQLLQDSIGTETINGRVFVIHRVSEKETLYGLSKRYGTTVDAIIEFNPTADAGLEIGQIIKIPYVPRSVIRAGAGQIHTVAAKETMFSISQLYNVSIEEIKRWNNLSDNALSIGQELVIKASGHEDSNVVTTSVSTDRLHVVEPRETMFSISKRYGVTINEIRDWNKLEGNEISIGQELIVIVGPPKAMPKRETPQPVVEPKVEVDKQFVPSQPEVKEQTIRISESVKNTDEIMQSGLAELIEGTEGNRKYLALHRTAPVGTILKVRNEMNNREVFVRVMGKLPDTPLTNKLVIKISKSAYDRLGAIDSRFRVEVTYYK